MIITIITATAAATTKPALKSPTRCRVRVSCIRFAKCKSNGSNRLPQVSGITHAGNASRLTGSPVVFSIIARSPSPSGSQTTSRSTRPSTR